MAISKEERWGDAENYIWLRKHKAPAPVEAETREQLIKRLAPGYEECGKWEADVCNCGDCSGLYSGRSGIFRRLDGEWTFRISLCGGLPRDRYIWLRSHADATPDETHPLQDDVVDAAIGPRYYIPGFPPLDDNSGISGFVKRHAKLETLLGERELRIAELERDLRVAELVAPFKEAPAPTERWRPAIRGDALKALANGERVERKWAEYRSWSAMRWSERGAEFLWAGGWSLDSFHPDAVYRVLDSRPRRTFLDHWVEVDTFAEAEPAGEHGTETPQALFVVDGKYLERGHADLVLSSAGSYWVARNAPRGLYRRDPQAPEGRQMNWTVRP